MFQPHAICLAWSKPLIIGEILANAGIAFTYFMIPLILSRVIKAIPHEAPAARMFFCIFAIFIPLCGVTHIMEIVVLFWPLYVLKVAIGLVTMISSFIAVWFIAPLAAVANKNRKDLLC